MTYSGQALSDVPHVFHPSPRPPQESRALGASVIAGPFLPIGLRPSILPHLVPGTRLRTNEELPSAFAECGLLVVLEGVLARCVWAEPGKRRIVGLLVGGDMSRGLVHRDRDREWFVALTPCRVTKVLRASVDRLLVSEASFALEFAHIAEGTAAIQQEWLRNDARLSELRLAHRICEVMTRAATWLGTGQGILLPPIRQTAWADMTAMTSIHVNRCLKRLVSAGLIRVACHDIIVLDPKRLAAFAVFDSSYLRIEGRN